MKCRHMLPVLLVLIVGAACADDAPYALVNIRSNGVEAIPVSVAVNFTEIGKALGTPAFVDAAKLVAAEEMAGGTLRPVVAQFDPAEGFEAHKNAAGVLSLILPAGRPGDRRIRVYFTGVSPRLAAPPAAQGLQVVQDQGRITVGNDAYKVTHAADKMGGLPSKIEWPKTGKVFDSFSMNDRVYDPAIMGYALHDDKNPEVKLVANGPVRAVVRVKARYMQGDKQPASHPVGVYEFAYYAGSPMVRVSARIAQESPRSWSELHFIEINFPDQAFTKYVYGDPVSEAEFKAAKKGFGPVGWGALSDGKNYLGLLGARVQFYDGRGEYGTYIHGPWMGWDGAASDFSAYLWINSAEGTDSLKAAAAGALAGSEVIVTTQPLLDKLARIRERIASLPLGAQRGRFSWVTDQIEKMATVRGEIGEAWTLANKIGSALVEGKSAYDAVPWALKADGAWTRRGLAMTDDGEVGLGFERTDKGLALVSLYGFTAQREMLSGKATAFWSAEGEVKKPGADTPEKKSQNPKLTLSSLSGWGEVTARMQAGALMIGFAKPAQAGAEGVTATVQVNLEGPRTAWKLGIANASKVFALRDIYFPQVQLGKIGNSADDDDLVYPAGSGIIAHKPLAAGFNGFSARYPGGWSTMQFMSYYDPDCGLYVASHDPVGSSKDMQIRIAEGGQTGEQSDNSVRGLDVKVQWYAADCGVPGNSFVQSGSSALQVFNGDWYDATQIYKAWVSRYAKWWPKDRDRKDTPQWMHDMPIWAQTGGGPNEVVPATRKFAEFMNEPVGVPGESPKMPVGLHWYSWHQIPFDVNYPHYFPVKEGFKEGVAELQKAGVRVMPYINGRLWDSALDDFKNGAIAAATKDEQGKPYIEEYGSGAKLAPMCPTTKLWQSKQQEIVMRLMTEYGVDGVYMDQIAAASPALCFDKSHGHPLAGGQWWTVDGYWPLLTELRRQYKAAGLDKFLTTECNAEPYIHCFDGYLTWHFGYNNQIPMFASVYAGRIQPFSRAYGGDEIAQCMKAGQQLIFGEQLGWCDPRVVDSRPKFAAFIRQCARIRYAERDCLAYGDMARPPLLRGEMPTITADWTWDAAHPNVTTDAVLTGAWKAKDGKVAFIFANVTEQPVKVQWVFDGAAYGLSGKVQVTKRTETGIEQPAVEESKFVKTMQVPARTVWVWEVK